MALYNNKKKGFGFNMSGPGETGGFAGGNLPTVGGSNYAGTQETNYGNPGASWGKVGYGPITKDVDTLPNARSVSPAQAGNGAYKSPYTSEYDTGYYGALKNRSGGSFDSGFSSKPIEGANGVAEATQGYDLTPQQDAIAGYRKPGLFKETYQGANYNPYQFNFKGLPEEYGTQAYNSGAKDVLRQGQGALEKQRENIGTRRLGLLSKVGEANERDTGENLAGLRAKISLQQMMSNIDMAKSQQEAQAGENLRGAQFNAGEGYKGYQSRSDLERANEDNKFRHLAGLEGAGKGLIGTQSGLVGQERDYRDQAMEMLQRILSGSAGWQTQAATLDQQKKQNTIATLSGLANAGANIGNVISKFTS